MCVLKV